MKGPGSSAGSLRRLEPSMKAQEGVINILGGRKRCQELLILSLKPSTTSNLRLNNFG
jgi:hypothetical protein